MDGLTLPLLSGIEKRGGSP